MLSPSTFIGIASATTPAAQPAPTGRPNIRPARILTTPPVAAPGAPPGAPPVAPQPQKPVTTLSPNQPATPPRNLPRGSLLDLSV